MIMHALRTETAVSYPFVLWLLKIHAAAQNDLANNLLYSSEQRRARALLSISRPADHGGLQPALKVSQQTLAQMIGGTRQRVNLLMKRLLNLGLIQYAGGFKVHCSIVDAITKRGRAR